MSVSVTLVFPDAAAAADALARVAGVVAPADRPDAGAPTITVALPVAPVVPPFDPAKAFGGTPVDMQPVTVVPGVVVVPPGPPALPPAPAAVGSTPISELDSAGLPWDPRIHTETKSKNADNTWRAKRNTDKTFKAQVEAELRAAVGAPSAPAGTAAQPAPVTAPLATLPPAAAVPPLPALVLPATTVPSPAASAAPLLTPPPPLPATNATPTDFGSLMAATAPMFEQDPLGATERMKAALAGVGLSAIGQLAVRPDLIPNVYSALFPAAA